MHADATGFNTTDLHDAIDFNGLEQLVNLLRQQGYSHTTVSPATHQLVNARPQNAFAKSVVDILGWSRPFVKEAISAPLFALMQQANILQQAGPIWRSRIRVSTLGHHYFVHSAYPTQEADAIFFGPDTYRFIHALTQFFAANPQPLQRAVDIGTGGGAAALALAQAFPQAVIYGADINETALAYARCNARSNGLPQLQFVNSNLLTNLEGEFDFITANPPYLVDETLRTYRHGGGQYGYQLALDIIENALPRLRPGGALLLYTGVAMIAGKDLFLAEVTAKLTGTPFTFTYQEIDVDIFADELLHAPYQLADRIAAVVLTINKPATNG